MKEYIEFLKDKMAISHQTGFEVNPDELTPSLYPHVKDTVRWAISGGCRAIFSSFGMQKTVTQLEILRVVLKHRSGKGLIVCPKRVVVEFLTQAEQHLHMKVTYVRTMADVVIRCLDLAGLRGWDLQDTLDNVDELNDVSDFFQEHTFVEIVFDICTGTIISESTRSVKGVILDVWQYCLWKGIDIEWFIEQKMRYNELRPMLNGKKY
jgi:hypothetical protein